MSLAQPTYREQLEASVALAQRSLFDPPSNGTATSEAAAAAIEPGAGEARLLAWLRENGPATDQEMQAALGWAGDYQRPRRWGLAKAKLIERTGETRTTSGGKQAQVWRVV